MKKTLFIVLSVLALAACKKSSGDTTAAAPSNSITATLNGQPFTTGSTALMYTANGGGGYISIGGQTASQKPYQSISFQFSGDKYGKAGTYKLTNGFGLDAVSVSYDDEAGIQFHAIAGTLEVTQADTGRYGFTNMEATFSFKTDTVSGKAIAATGGKIIFHRK